ncbi:alpha/beta fold hydrolase [Paenirhodobacter sp.]|uniref:alpha/beta fold hydrolase n=1 Tax=Paenirhodobacter sp. TaxID=1965326 RepID=UPI003B422333
MTAVILIHGAWQGSWAWDAFVPLLRAAGFDPVAVDLPGNGTGPIRPEDVSAADCLTHLEGVLNRTGPAHVIGHSGGGVFASMLAEARPDAVLSLTYVAGMMLPDGGSFARIVADLLPEHPEAAGIGPWLIWSDDRRLSRVPPEAARKIFLHDCPPDAAQRLTPQGEGARAVTPRLTPARYGRVPRLYVEATGDRSVVLAVQRRMQELSPGAERATLTTGHVPQLAAPADLLAVIRPFLMAHEPLTQGAMQ